MMRNLLLKIILIFSVVQISFSQDLMNERIRKIGDKKRSVYFKGGVFHSSVTQAPSSLKAIRHGYQPANGFERLVFDFTTDVTPRIYGYKSENEKKIFIDLFSTSLGSSIGSFGNSKFVEKVEFYPIGDETLSTEIILKGDYSIDIFYLEKPGRLVIDIKN